MTTILVTGATGHIGREIVRALLDKGVSVRALTRDPDTADLPEGADVVRGDLTDVASLKTALEGVDGVHLITFDGPRLAGGGAPLSNHEAIIDAVRASGARAVTVLGPGYPSPLDQAVTESDLPWTVLKPTEFMTNALEWAPAVAETSEIAEPYVERQSAAVHPADVGDVAAEVLTGADHAGTTYVITGPEALSVREKVQALSGALGREVTLRELTPEEGEAKWRADGFGDDMVGFFHWVYGNPPAEGRTVTTVVEELTGHSARPFSAWASENAARFTA